MSYKKQQKPDVQYERMTLKDAIDILSVYDLQHCRFPGNYVRKGQLLGLADDTKKLILIDNEQPLEIVREVVLHELYHALHYMRGDLHGISYGGVEKIVDREAQKHAEQLFRKMK